MIVLEKVPARMESVYANKDLEEIIVKKKHVQMIVTVTEGVLMEYAYAIKDGSYQTALKDMSNMERFYQMEA
jgi:hypothetical protein